MTRQVISFVTMKGGSGKSTLALSLAARWHAAGIPVALVDADPAGTLVRWIAAGDDLTAIPALTAGPDDIAAQIDSLLAGPAARVIVDTPGFHSAATDTAIRRADLIVIPMRPSPVDFQVAADTLEHIERVSGGAGGTPRQARFLLNQTTRGSVIARHMRAELERAGLAALRCELPSRVAYCEAALAGTTPVHYQPGGAAAADIADFAAEMESLLAGG